MKLLMEIEFYKIILWLVFMLTGYAQFTFKGFLKSILPIYGIGTGFTGSYLVFFLFIPFLNRLIHVMDEKMHIRLIALCLFTGTMLQTFLKAPDAFTYVGWFMVLYFIASYIRLYPKKIFGSRRIWGWLTLAMLILSWCSILAGAVVYNWTGMNVYYYFVSDSNKVLAVATAVCAFLFFKNLHLNYHSVINKVASSTFGVLLIHANSDTMRQWLWGDVLNNVGAFHSNHLIIHAFSAVIAIYAICSVIDFGRIMLFEKPFFRWYDNE